MQLAQDMTSYHALIEFSLTRRSRCENGNSNKHRVNNFCIVVCPYC